ncbi:Uncharacterized protein HZ326_22075 [Fusarium oxysporum f. sp. albedinis]|nr:Uncharacterized protein HZ326_22075 [Fusarium oxysporum f. sp. albedinis]
MKNRFFGDEAVKLISIPTVAATYNDEMNHVDRGDQMRAYQGYDHPIRRGAWQALTWTFLLDVVLGKSVKAEVSDWRRIYAYGTVYSYPKGEKS